MRERWRHLGVQRGSVATPATMWLVGAEVVLFVVSAVVPPVLGWITAGAWPDHRFQYWRAVTYGLTSASLLSLVLNVVGLYLVGRSVEETMGTLDFAALYLLSGVGAATVLTMAGTPVAYGGAFSGVLGTVAASAVLRHRAHEDIRGDLAVMGLFVLLAFLGSGGLTVGRSILSGEWIGDLGAIAVGASVGAVHWAARRRRGRAWPGYTALACVCVAALTLTWTMSSFVR